MIGIHDGAYGQLNYATHLAGTPLAEVLTPDGGLLWDGGVMSRDAGTDATRDAARDVTVDASDASMREASTDPETKPEPEPAPRPTEPPPAVVAEESGCAVAPRAEGRGLGSVVGISLAIAAAARRRRR